jgi:hypothetical protein
VAGFCPGHWLWRNDIVAFGSSPVTARKHDGRASILSICSRLKNRAKQIVNAIVIAALSRC